MFTNLALKILSIDLGKKWTLVWLINGSIFKNINTISFLISKTSFYKQIILTGSDERASFVSGVRINTARLGAHVIAGVFVGLGAIAFTAMIGSGDPVQGNRYTLQAVTALVLGGTSLAGGRGGGFGSIIGAINMYLIFYVLSSFNFGIISGFVTQMFYGLILVISLIINILTTSIRVRE